MIPLAVLLAITILLIPLILLELVFLLASASSAPPRLRS